MPRVHGIINGIINQSISHFVISFLYKARIHTSLCRILSLITFPSSVLLQSLFLTLSSFLFPPFYFSVFLLEILFLRSVFPLWPSSFILSILLPFSFILFYCLSPWHTLPSILFLRLIFHIRPFSIILFILLFLFHLFSSFSIFLLCRDVPRYVNLFLVISISSDMVTLFCFTYIKF